MRNKRTWLFFFAVFFLSLAMYQSFIKPNRMRPVETYLRGFPKQEFQHKVRSKHPGWMQNQINNDFLGFYKKGISISSIDKTLNHISNTVPLQKKAFIRYRIIDNKLYRYFPQGSELTKKEPSFEKAVKTLTKLVNLPDIDLIYSDMDGTPEFYMANDFYILEDLKSQAPIFSRAKTKSAPYVVLIPDYYSVSTMWEEDVIKLLDQMKQYPWSIKSQLAFWRGGSHDKGYDIQSFKKRPRVVISLLSKEYPHLVEAGINQTEHMQFKEVLLDENLVKPHATIEEHLKFKYLPVLDGYMCTYPGYQWRLLSNSVCFKQNSTEIQWFYSALEPYVHYVPIENDMSDLIEKVNWAKRSDQKCERIAKNATGFVLNNLMIEDVYLFLYKVFMTYEKYLSINKKELLENTKSDPGWICIQQRKKANKILMKRMKDEK